MEVRSAAPSTAACREELAQILASSVFASAERLGQFLSYVVEEALAGRSDRIKEYSIGVSVYGKPSDYDPRIDATVRGEASRLRARLLQFYAGSGRDHKLRIEIPKGAYRPVFLTCGDPSKTQSAHDMRPGSIAVLPFKPLVSDAAETQEALGLALADALITTLGPLDGLLVLSTSAVRRYVGTASDPVAIARELGVDTVLDGNFQRHNDRIRVTAQLLRAADGKHLWAGLFEQRFEDIFTAQDAITMQLARALRPELTRDITRPSIRPRGLDAKTYETYAQGRYHLLKYSRSGTRKAIQAFEQVTIAAPDYVRGHAGLALAYLQAPVFLVHTNKEAWLRALCAAQKAVAAAPNVPEALAAMGAVQFFYGWDFDAARRNLEVALSAQPADPEPYIVYGDLLDTFERSDAALSVKKTAVELDPTSSMTHLRIASSYWFLRQYNEVINWCKKALDLDPENVFAQYRIGGAYYALGMYDEWAPLAIHLAREYGDCKCDEPSELLDLYQRNGPHALLRRLVPADRACGLPFTVLATCYSETGDRDRALTCLERAYEDRERTLVHLNVDPLWEELRTETRFAQLVGRIGLPVVSKTYNHAASRW